MGLASARSPLFPIVVGDAGPPMVVALTAAGDAYIVDAATDPKLLALAPFVLNATTDTAVLNYVDSLGVARSAVMSIVSASGGTVQRAWAFGDLPAVGSYAAQVVVARAGDATLPRTFPDDGGRLTIVVAASIAAAVPAPPTTNYINDNASTLPIGTPVYQTSPGHADVASTTDLTHATVIGLRTAACASGASGPVQSSGPVILATSQWDAITGQSGGLTRDAAYYLTGIGRLTTIMPTGPNAIVEPFGVADSTMQLDLKIQAPTQLSGPGLVAGFGDSNMRRAKDTWADAGLGLSNPQGIICQGMYASDPTAPITWTTIPLSALKTYDIEGNDNMGPEITLGQTLRAGGVAAAICHVNVDGTSIGVGWAPGGTLYNAFVAQVRATVLATGFPLKAIYMVDGNDALLLSLAQNYGANLAALLAQLRTDLGDFYFAFSRAPNFGSDVPYVAQLQASQDAFAAANPSYGYIQTSDLLLDTNGDQGDGDQHFIASSQIALGNRFGQAILGGWQSPSLVNNTSAPVYVGMEQVELSLELQTTLTPRWGGALPYAAGDLGILFAVCAGANQPITLASAQGFAQIGTTQISNGGGTTLCCAVFACVATSSNMPAPSVAFGTNQTNMAGIMIFRPPAGKTISVDQVAGAVNNAFNTSLALPTVTTTANNEIVVQPFAAYAFTNNPTVTAVNASLTNLEVVRDADQKMAGSNITMFGLITGDAPTAGLVSSTAVTMSTAEVLAGFTIALKAS